MSASVQRQCLEQLFETLVLPKQGGPKSSCAWGQGHLRLAVQSPGNRLGELLRA